MSAEIHFDEDYEMKAHEKLQPLLNEGEELITNADRYGTQESGPMRSDGENMVGIALAIKLNNSEIWESARVIDVAYTTDGELVPTNVSVVGVRRKI